MKEDLKHVGDYFNTSWSECQKSVKADILSHNKMFGTLDQFLKSYFADRANRPCVLADLGCGDGSAIRDTLLDKPISKYIGVDMAESLLAEADKILADLKGSKAFICEDMQDAIVDIKGPLDIIFSSYALHYLRSKKKVEFIAHCREKLGDGGHFILVDTILGPTLTREEWLSLLEDRFRKRATKMTEEQIQKRLQHPRETNFPENIETYRRIAEEQHWKSFEVLVNVDDLFAFMVFSR